MSSSDKCNPPPTLSLSLSSSLAHFDIRRRRRMDEDSVNFPFQPRKCTEREKETKQKNQAKYKIGSQPRTYLIYKYDELSLLSYKD
jgi:hypothetical protein